MLIRELSEIVVEQKPVASQHLKRYVITDVYLPRTISGEPKVSLLLINDGQDLEEMKFASILDQEIASGAVHPLICIGIHANKDRKQEYGTAGVTDYEGRGKKAAAYQQFLMLELLPAVQRKYNIDSFESIAICGFSLGGLSAIDTALNHSGVFSKVGVFSGSLWWRSRDLDDEYNDELHRIMHVKVRSSELKSRMKFYFTTGSLDETADRNKNGIIDSIDDTIDLIAELKKKGIAGHDISYHNFPDGKHDLPTWGKALPGFLRWGWGMKSED